MNKETTVAKLPNVHFSGSQLDPDVLEALPELVHFANTVADAARQPSLESFRAGSELSIKADGSPVTLADQETERVIRNLLSQDYPQHAIIGEEHGETLSDQPYTWIIDPIDGTKSYLAGQPTYGMLLALLHDGTPILGIIDIPTQDERWCGVVGQPTTMNGRPVKSGSCTTLAQAVLTIISPDNLKEGERPAVEKFSRMARVRRYASDGYAYPLVASGYTDMVIASGQQIFDYLPVVPVIEGAGGCISDWQGETLGLQSDGHVLVTATPELHREALSALQETIGSNR